jgi:hypothetical protein
MEKYYPSQAAQYRPSYGQGFFELTGLWTVRAISPDPYSTGFKLGDREYAIKLAEKLNRKAV